ncbi:O-antigen ligase family protein [Prevotella sp. PINT]|jgi:hypothetical protein|uniref:O-antigen ligase family protein n=1 Tax=Palleniella intestinalis TaxID=2736291 RepID=UPI00155282A8|nr:O-antigen ligase family protein [Palleniella intestinalis]NPD82810.1 O-antigen ligase family protein [Palleniella intestinalis]
MAAGDGGFAQAFQIVSLFGMLFIAYSHNKREVTRVFNVSNPAINTFLFFSFYALLSATWAFMPAFSAFLSVQNFILMALAFWLLSMPRTFAGVEKCLVYLILSMVFVSAIGGRYNIGWPIFIHLLQTGTCSAMCFAYCFAEWIKEEKDKKRLLFLRVSMLISLAFLVTSTSSGANASCVAGICVAMLFSGHAAWGALVACAGGLAFLLQDQLMDLLLLIMPGKNKDIVESATGRAILWEQILYFAAQKPILGWGFACAERVVSVKGTVLSPDAHNNYIGFYGSLGYIGCFLAGIHFIASFFFFFTNSIRRGYLGLLCVLVVALVNGYSYGFLSGKACIITIAYFAMIMAGYHFKRVQRLEQLMR